MSKLEDINILPHRYRIINTGTGSAKYGPCEVCNKHADTMYIQHKEYERVFTSGLMNGEKHWIHLGDVFGHEACLEKIRIPGSLVNVGGE